MVTKALHIKPCDKAIRIVLYLNGDRGHWVSLITGVTVTNWQVYLKRVASKISVALSVASHPPVSTSNKGEFLMANS